MAKNSFRDPITNVLKSWGYSNTNASGDLVQAETDDFNLNPADGWKWNGTSWVSQPFPPRVDQIKLMRKAILGNVAAKTQLQEIDNADI